MARTLRSLLLSEESPIEADADLAHELLAVGRWQKNKDLSWYAKGDDSQAAQDAAKARAEEIKRIKEAEQDALSAALGFAVEPRIRDSQLAGPKEVEKAIRETGEDEEEGGKGVGFGAYVGPAKAEADTSERLIGYVGEKGGLEGGAAKQGKRRGDTSRERESSRRHHRRHDGDHHRSYRRHRSRSRDRVTKRRSRSRSYERRREDEHSSRRLRRRSYSPDPQRRDRYRDRRDDRRR